jgi:hypothetical protein
MTPSVTDPARLVDRLVRAGIVLAQLRGLADAGSSADRDQRPLPPRDRTTPSEVPASPGDGALAGLIGGAASSALIAQIVRPRRVHWPRAVLAGVLGTLAYDAETVVRSVRAERKFGTRSAAAAGVVRALTRVEGARLAAGVGMAGFYAAFVHRRLPGPAVVHGLAYGAAEALTRGWGGPAGLLARVAPGVRVPAATGRGLARPEDGPIERFTRHLAFGATLAVIYGRAGR